MALKTCSNCGRVFSARRVRCPDCRRKHHGDREDDGLGRGARIGVVAIVILALVSGAYNLTRETGPSPELEALHSATDALAECRRGIGTAFSDREARVEGPLDVEYLQGGEYEVRGTAVVMAAGRRVTRPLFCEAQFRPDEGWTVYVELEG